MSDDPLDIDVDDLQRRMDGAMSSLKTEFASLRTGRASGSILDPVMVDAYGQMTPINQVGTVKRAGISDGNSECLGQSSCGQGGKKQFARVAWVSIHKPTAPS